MSFSCGQLNPTHIIIPLKIVCSPIYNLRRLSSATDARNSGIAWLPLATIDQSFIPRASFPSDHRNPSAWKIYSWSCSYSSRRFWSDQSKYKMFGLTPKIADAVSFLFYANFRDSCFIEYLNLRDIFSGSEERSSQLIFQFKKSGPGCSKAG